MKLRKFKRFFCLGLLSIEMLMTRKFHNINISNFFNTIIETESKVNKNFFYLEKSYKNFWQINKIYSGDNNFFTSYVGKNIFIHFLALKKTFSVTDSN